MPNLTSPPTARAADTAAGSESQLAGLIADLAIKVDALRNTQRAQTGRITTLSKQFDGLAKRGLATEAIWTDGFEHGAASVRPGSRPRRPARTGPRPDLRLVRSTP